MDEDTRAALAAIQTGIANLTASVALVARHQTIQGEKISRILDVLVPEEDEEEEKGPTTAELLGRMMAANAKAVKEMTAQLTEISGAVEGVPVNTVQAMGQAFNMPERKPG
ncbi:hypothetical protein ACFQY5_41520 [Paeniroseomonas aquatica]|uniref:Uncharacterized protein n=1 Tax=Paeniroseomonas aquatica TaxID=373043 RepID=A0ABT8A2A7_9PROT|nr:hypothetical protein [Paeniroseomonas aquatica]MDN3563862.1 hypothetical protein [Paeniroseomonas aquatica]